MRRLVLAALLPAALFSVAGCGGGGGSSDPISQVPDKGGLRQRVTAAQHVDVSAFPSAKGKSLQDVASEVKGAGKPTGHEVRRSRIRASPVIAATGR